ncbi:vanadium-dependent haloperoxidase [Massilia sp. PAMC28688]|uniref:vanadium-dependent haloperoxidase n=1 Tax=Massilia sp. PAMC28688 TaxID=2861283 RepID=UPI001C6256B5|nr:vanadium-dependent haloperoxidase [Massilia sp. PAMC28688]QYF92505.1 vanadium-dependent haloperoxidase [Massilia sp. PAMC28688]
MERRTFLRFTTGAAISGALAACGGGGGTSAGARAPAPHPAAPPPPASRVTVSWNNVALSATRTAAMPPTVASRVLAIVHTAIFNAWAAYDPVALSTRHGAAMRRPAAEHTLPYQVMALSYAAHGVLRDLFPAQGEVFDAHLKALGYEPAPAVTEPHLPQGVGLLSAAALLAWMHGDGANQLGTRSASGIAYADYTGYTPNNAPLLIGQDTPRDAIARPDRWQPLAWRDAGGALRIQTYATPFWGSVRPFALERGDQFRPPAPAAFGSALFAAQAEEIVAVQLALTDVHKASAEYWAGGASGELPVGHWSQFAQFVSARDHHTEQADVRMFFALANALFDAGIAAWDAKRAYDSARPITAVRYLLAGRTIDGYGPEGPAGGLRPIAGQAWMPFQRPAVASPPFPDHVSGHSTYSSASAVILRRFTGSDSFRHGVTIAARSLVTEPAAPAADVHLFWDTFTTAACEAGQSRIYAGIHFPAADRDGRVLGQRVGELVWEKAEAYWLGKA